MGKSASGKLKGTEVYQFGAGADRGIPSDVTCVTAFGLVVFGQWPEARSILQAAKRRKNAAHGASG